MGVNANTKCNVNVCKCNGVIDQLARHIEVFRLNRAQMPRLSPFSTHLMKLSAVQSSCLFIACCFHILISSPSHKHQSYPKLSFLGLNLN